MKSTLARFKLYFNGFIEHRITRGRGIARAATNSNDIILGLGIGPKAKRSLVRH